LLEVYRSSSLEDYAVVLRKCIEQREFVIIVGRCSVDYRGRGESKLASGERVVLLKQDGAVLVHRPTGYQPVNWQPSTSVIEVKVTGGALQITAIRDKPREVLSISFDRIDLLIHGKLEDSGEFIMYVDELEMRDILFEHPEIIEEGLKIREKEKQIDGGSIDLFGYDKEGRPVIIELKRVTADREAVYQLYSYVKAYMDKTGVKPRGILVAPSFTQSALEALQRLKLEWREINLKKLWSLKRAGEVRQPSILEYLERRDGGA